MKKRILALALAGTTAFSVFGAAMSANAAVANSTHTAVSNDAYVSYSDANVATTIHSVAAVAATSTPIYTNVTTGEIGFTDVDLHMSTKEVKDHYTADELISVWGVWINANTGKVANVDANGKPDGTYKAANETDVARAMTELHIVPTTTTSSNAAYIVNGRIAADTLEEALLIGAANATPACWRGHYNKRVADSSTAYITTAEYNALPTKAAYIDANLVITGYNPTAAARPAVLTVNNGTPADWAWNADTTGDATINFMVYDNNNTASGKKYQKTIFAYDFVYNNNMDGTAADVAGVWSDATKAANTIGTHNLDAERGMGVPYKGVRYEVVNEWKDFLEELAIYNDGKNYYESRADFIDLYKDMLYGDPVYDINTGKFDHYVDVDLYNITGLLNDIYDLNTDAAISAANTSEMVYLMQQYKHYIGNYIDVAEVETTDWGALMLSILESAEASDFKKAPDYKKYVNRVEELADAYEAATTANMIKAAEQGMYDLLTNSAYRANAANKAELNASMEALYFNVGSAPATYTVNYKTVDTNNVDYKNFTYFKAGVVNKFAIEEGFKYYSLYPQADYNELYNKVTAYTGNTANAYTGDATDEYEWFLNVYELAYNMKKGNLYQGSIDAVNEALNAAVEALEVTVTPYNSEVAAKEDMMDYIAKSVKEEADYDKSYYGMYTKAVDYAEDVAEGKMQQRVAREIVAIAGDSLTWQGAQVVVTKNDMKTVKAAIADGQKALKAIKDSKDYNAAQVNALNKAIAKAQAVVDLYDGVAAATINHANTTLVADKDQIVKSDLTNAIDAINAAIDYSEIVMGWSKNAAGKWMYGKEEGYLNNGWNKIGSVWYYFNEDGTAKQSEWYKEGSKWYYFNSNAGAAIGWAKVDGDWYYFGGDNAMKTGWQKVDGNWYYLASSGKMTTGWVQVGGKWYYMSKESNSLGQMLANTTVEGYKLGADGAMIEK